MEDKRFKVSNQRKFILVIGLIGQGKSSFINFMTDKEECEVSDLGASCTKDYKMVEMIFGNENKTFYFVDTPGLDDADGDKNNIEEIKKFSNKVSRINTIIFCQSLTDHKFTQSIKTLFQLMKDLYKNDTDLYKHLFIVRTKSDRESKDFESNKKAAENYDNKDSFYNKIKTFFSVEEGKKIPLYFLDSKYQDDDSENEKKIFLKE